MFPGPLPPRKCWPQRSPSLSSSPILKTRNLGMRLRTRRLIQKLEFRNLFLPASCKAASFPLVLDLMRECYVISFPYFFFHFLIWKRSCFVVRFHISSQKHQGNEISILFFTLRTRENSEKLKLLSTTKTRFFFVSNYWCGCM